MLVARLDEPLANKSLVVVADHRVIATLVARWSSIAGVLRTVRQQAQRTSSAARVGAPPQRGWNEPHGPPSLSRRAAVLGG